MSTCHGQYKARGSGMASTLRMPVSTGQKKWGWGKFFGKRDLLDFRKTFLWPIWYSYSSLKVSGYHWRAGDYFHSNKQQHWEIRLTFFQSKLTDSEWKVFCTASICRPSACDWGEAWDTHMSWQAQLRQRKIPTALESIRKLTLIQNLVVVLHVQTSSEIFSVFPLTEICWNITIRTDWKNNSWANFCNQRVPVNSVS